MLEPERLVASRRSLTPKGPKSLEQSCPDRKRAIVPRVRSTACGWRSFGSIRAQSRGEVQTNPGSADSWFLPTNRTYQRQHRCSKESSEPVLRYGGQQVSRIVSRNYSHSHRRRSKESSEPVARNGTTAGTQRRVQSLASEDRVHYRYSKESSEPDSEDRRHRFL